MTDLYVDLGELLGQSRKWGVVQGQMAQAGSTAAATTSGLDNGKGWRSDDFISAYRAFSEKFFSAVGHGETDAQNIGSTLGSVIKAYAERDHLNMDEIEKAVPK